MADLSIGRVPTQSAPVANGTNLKTLDGQKSFTEVYKEAILRANGYCTNDVQYDSTSNQANPGVLNNSANYLRLVKMAEESAEMTEEPIQMGEALVKTPTERASYVSDENIQTDRPEYIIGLNGEVLKLRYLTDEDYIAAGYDIEVLKANALDVDPLSFVNSFGDVPLYVVPVDLGRSIDYKRTVGTAENIAETLANNTAFGFPAEVSASPLVIQSK